MVAPPPDGARQATRLPSTRAHARPSRAGGRGPAARHSRLPRARRPTRRTPQAWTPRRSTGPAEAPCPRSRTARPKPPESTFSATLRLSDTCRASWTTSMPPRPTRGRSRSLLARIIQTPRGQAAAQGYPDGLARNSGPDRPRTHHPLLPPGEVTATGCPTGQPVGWRTGAGGDHPRARTPADTHPGAASSLVSRPGNGSMTSGVPKKWRYCGHAAGTLIVVSWR
jgi:hypothetical protein